MKKVILMFFGVLFLINCSKIITKKKEDVLYYPFEVNYLSHALKQSHLTQNVEIKDEKNDLDYTFLKDIKKNLKDKKTVNFINFYNDSLAVVYSFPVRNCLKFELKNYLDNFSESKQYVFVKKNNHLKIDSLIISHETRIVPPIDCGF